MLVGYLHASFANGSGYVRMADVPDEWDVINLSFGEPTSVTSGDIRFRQCPAAECPNVESEAEFIAAIRAKQAAGKKVLISIGGQNGQVQLTGAAARDTFVRSVSAIIDKYGLDGLDIDFEGHSLYLDNGDTNLANPTTPVIVNLIAALKTLKAKYGAKFVLTMAPETFFVQLGHQFYGPGPNGAADRRAASYLPVIHAMRDDLTLLHVQDYNSGPIMGLDGQFHTMGTHDFHVAMTDMLLAGFPIMGNAANVFPPLRQEQVAIGLPAAPWAATASPRWPRCRRPSTAWRRGRTAGRTSRRGLSEAARPDDLVDQLGPVQRVRVLPQPPGLPRRTRLTGPSQTPRRRERRTPGGEVTAAAGRDGLPAARRFPPCPARVPRPAHGRRSAHPDQRGREPPWGMNFAKWLTGVKGRTWRSPRPRSRSPSGRGT
nr:hypothetical protein GCM10020093_100730 [Planobispora longispora]